MIGTLARKLRQSRRLFAIAAAAIVLGTSLSGCIIIERGHPHHWRYWD
jgi:hypothetical protein